MGFISESVTLWIPVSSIQVHTVVHSPRTPRPLITTPPFPPVTGRTFLPLHSLPLLLPPVPHPLFNPILLRPQVTAQAVTSLSIRIISSTRHMLVPQRVARRMRVSNTRIMGMRCTLSHLKLKAGQAHTVLDLRRKTS